jgi:hypothetical protein
MKLSEQQIIKELIDEHQTVEQILQRYKITKQGFYKRLRNLIKKGYIKRRGNNNYFKGKKMLEPTGSEKSHPFIKCQNIRLHGQRLRIGFFHAKNKYYKLLALLKTFKHNGFSVRLHKKCIQVFMNKSFIGVDPLDAKGKSLKFILDLIPLLEETYGVTLIKKGKHLIKVYQEEYAEQNNELARESEKKGEKIVLRDEKDGRIWLKADKSFNLHELETSHPKHAYKDMEEVIQPFMRTLRENPQILNILVDSTKTLTENMNSFVISVNKLIDAQAEKLKPNNENMTAQYENLEKPYYVG